MERDWLALILAIIDTMCWVICFIWMHKLSTKQNNLLDKLTEQSKRIEKLSKEEHALIKEVHPQVEEIHQDMKELKETAQDQEPSRGRSSK